MYVGADLLQLDVLDIVDNISLRRDCGVEPVHAAPQPGHMSVEALLDPLQGFGEGVEAAADSLQFGQSSVQAVAGSPALSHFRQVILINDLDLFAQAAKPNRGVVDVIRQLFLQII